VASLDETILAVSLVVNFYLNEEFCGVNYLVSWNLWAGISLCPMKSELAAPDKSKGGKFFF
jgi:hypothetical protein